MLGNAKFVFAAALILATSMLLYVRRVLVPFQQSDAVAHDHPRGNLSDLYPRWLGARELFLRHRDPYSPQITREIQIGYYGRALDPSRRGDPADQQAFAYPLYVVFLLAPLVHFPFSGLHAIFYWVMALVTVFSVLLWLRALSWKLPNYRIAGLILLTLGSLQVMQAIELQQLTLLIAALLALCAVLLIRGNFFLSGIILAIATIKPQLVLPVAAWLIVWALSDWRRRQNFVWGFLGIITTLLIASEYVLPGWFREFLAAIQDYRRYTQGTSEVDHLAGTAPGLVLRSLLILLTAAICWRVRGDSANSERFIFTFTLVLTVTIVDIPSLSTYNEVLLLPAILLLLRQGPTLWNANPTARVVWILAGIALFWPWVAAFGLSTASFALRPATVQHAWALPFYTTMVIPLAVLGLLLQYAIRSHIFLVDHRLEPRA